MSRGDIHDAAGEYDPISLEILWSRLTSITDEAAAALVRTSFSTIVRESNDYACVLMDRNGNSLSENRNSIPSFVGCLGITTRSFLQRYPHETWKPGDVMITNDPWLATGHKPDISMVSPVFYKGRLVAFAGSIAHSPDIGGTIWSADAREVFEEGLMIPPTKLMKGGALNEELVEMITRNVRLPEQVMGDLFAQATAGQVCGNRLIELMHEEQMDDLGALASAIQDRAEEAMRKAIEQVPEGTYEHAVEMDGFDYPLRIQCCITVKDRTVEVDYAGTSQQIPRGGLNSVWNYTWSYTTYPLKCALDPTSPKNEGSYRPIIVKAPEGSLLNPRYPAAVNARQLTGHFLSAAIYGALVQAIPHLVIADSGSSPTFRTVYTGTGRDGERFSFILFANGGMGARPGSDGLPCTPFPTNSTCASIEVMEGLSPLLVKAKQIRQDSGGAGQYRGGFGQEIVVQVISTEPVVVSVIADRVNHPPLGLLGGHPGAPTQIILNEGGAIHPKSRTTLKPGDFLTLRYAGGGGYGDPRQRDRALVAADVRNEIVSQSAARELYGWQGNSRA